jgi:hypothetical protein
MEFFVRQMYNPIGRKGRRQKRKEVEAERRGRNRKKNSKGNGAAVQEAPGCRRKEMR